MSRRVWVEPQSIQLGCHILLPLAQVFFPTEILTKEHKPHEYTELMKKLMSRQMKVAYSVDKIQ